MSISFWPAIQQMVGGDFASPTMIVRDSQWTIVSIDTSGVVGGNIQQYVQLPSGCDIGDLVEFHFNSSSNRPQVNPPSGETFNSGVPIISGAKFFRKIDSTVWGSND